MLSIDTTTIQGENAALSYRNLRAIIGYIGLTLPVVLLLAGAIDGHLESSMSAYYYTKVGNVFTGALCVIGVFLVAYRLASVTLENAVTTLAGLAAIGVAFFHAAPANATLGQLRLADVHLTCAAALFILVLRQQSRFLRPGGSMRHRIRGVVHPRGARPTEQSGLRQCGPRIGDLAPNKENDAA